MLTSKLQRTANFAENFKVEVKFLTFLLQTKGNMVKTAWNNSRAELEWLNKAAKDTG